MPDTVNLKKIYSLLNEKLIDLFDGSGIKRSRCRAAPTNATSAWMR